MGRFLFLYIFCICTLSAETHFILMGAPGAGKGTLTRYLKEHDSFEHLCVGDLLRDEMARDTDYGRTFNQYVRSGELVPTELFFQFFENKVSTSLANGKQLIIDGIIQSQENIDFIDDLLRRYEIVDSTFFIYLNVDRDTAFERLVGRRICEECHLSYPLNCAEEFCASCNSRLVKRLDDTNETIMRRINRFYGSTIKLLPQFFSRQKFIEIDGTLDLNTLLFSYSQILQEIS